MQLSRSDHAREAETLLSKADEFLEQAETRLTDTLLNLGTYPDTEDESRLITLVFRAHDAYVRQAQVHATLATVDRNV